MANEFQLQLDSANAEKTLRSLIASVQQPRRLMAGVCGAVRNLLIENFRKLDSEKSKYGHKFYIVEGARATKSYPAQDGNSGEVVVHSRPMLHKLLGGTVRPVNAKHLAIPVSDWAKKQKRPPSQIDGLQFVQSASTRKPLLARIIGSGKNSKISVEYVLLKSVTHKPHAGTIPSESAVNKEVLTSAERFAAMLESKVA